MESVTLKVISYPAVDSDNVIVHYITGHKAHGGDVYIVNVIIRGFIVSEDVIKTIAGDKHVLCFKDGAKLEYSRGLPSYPGFIKYTEAKRDPSIYPVGSRLTLDDFYREGIKVRTSKNVDMMSGIRSLHGLSYLPASAIITSSSVWVAPQNADIYERIA